MARTIPTGSAKGESQSKKAPSKRATRLARVPGAKGAKPRPNPLANNFAIAFACSRTERVENRSRPIGGGFRKDQPSIAKHPALCRAAIRHEGRQGVSG